MNFQLFNHVTLYKVALMAKDYDIMIYSKNISHHVHSKPSFIQTTLVFGKKDRVAI